MRKLKPAKMIMIINIFKNSKKFSSNAFCFIFKENPKHFSAIKRGHLHTDKNKTTLLNNETTINNREN